MRHLWTHDNTSKFTDDEFSDVKECETIYTASATLSIIFFPSSSRNRPQHLILAPNPSNRPRYRAIANLPRSASAIFNPYHHPPHESHPMTCCLSTTRMIQSPLVKSKLSEVLISHHLTSLIPVGQTLKIRPNVLVIWVLIRIYLIIVYNITLFLFFSLTTPCWSYIMTFDEHLRPLYNPLIYFRFLSCCDVSAIFLFPTTALWVGIFDIYQSLSINW